MIINTTTIIFHSLIGSVLKYNLREGQNNISGLVHSSSVVRCVPARVNGRRVTSDDAASVCTRDVTCDASSVNETQVKCDWTRQINDSVNFVTLRKESEES